MPDQLRDGINEAWEQMVPTPGLRTSLNRVERLLKPKERVVVMGAGRHEEALGLLVLTDSRALFVSRTAATTIAAGLGYAALTAAEMFDEEGQFAVDLSTADDTATINEMHEADAQELTALLVEEIAAAAPALPRRSRVPVASPAAVPLPTPPTAGTLAAAAAAPPAPVVASPPTSPAAPWAAASLSPKAAARVEKRYRKAARPFYRKKRFLLPLTLLIIIIAAFVGVSQNNKKVEDAAAVTCVGKTYPDQQKKDRCADASGTVALSGVTVKAAPLAKKKDVLGTQELCSKVGLTNGSDTNQDYNIFDFKVQPPSGAVESASTLTIAETLGSGTLIRGASKTGLVCTDDKGEKGEYVLVYKPNPFAADRGIWLFTV